MTSVKRNPEMWKRRFVLDPMRRLQRAVHSGMLVKLAGLGYPDVRVQHLNVFAMVPRDEGMRMAELADRLQLTPGAVTQLVDQLERQRLVERGRDPSDGRAVRVRPTGRAERGYEEGRKHLAALEAEWSDLVGPRRWATFKQVLFEVLEHEEEKAGIVERP